jgi:hypothetical protein
VMRPALVFLALMLFAWLIIVGATKLAIGW